MKEFLVDRGNATSHLRYESDVPAETPAFQILRLNATRRPDAQAPATVYSRAQGLHGKVVLIVNETKFKERALGAGEVRRFDVASAMRPGTDNTITVRVRGRKGATALIVIADIP